MTSFGWNRAGVSNRMEQTQKNAFLTYYNAARNPLTHKGDYGRVFIVAGSEGMTGAAMLCAESALRAGAGLVYLFAPGKLLPIYEIGCREAVKIKVGGDGEPCFRQTHVRQIAETITSVSGRTAAVIGPGLGRDPQTRLFVRGLMEALSGTAVPVVLDADGLHAFNGQPERLAYFTSDGRARLVLTPHEAELSRLMGMDIADIDRNRPEAAVKAAALTGAVTVLKGSGTIIADMLSTQESLCEINPSGNPGMATGGSGDVLAGILAGILASDQKLGRQGVSDRQFYDLVRCGVYIHGLCGDLAAEKYGQRAMKAGDLIEMLKEVHLYGI